MRLFISTFVLAFLLSLGAQLDAQPTNWRGERMALEREFGDELQEIAQWCRANGIEDQVDYTFKLYQYRDLGRQYIFLPSDKKMPVGPTGINGEWLEKVNQAKINHAERILKLAERAAKEDSGTFAYQLLHDVIHYNRDHEAVRKMLGHKKTEDGWKFISEQFRVQKTRDHDILDWPAKSYIRVLTPHFEIDSNAGEERTKYLAEKLERWHMVWRQVFFEYWSSAKAIQGWISGKGAARIPTKRYRVIFFADRQGYLNGLSRKIKGIEVSEGYYSRAEKVSFFYDGPAQVEDTWRHELTHQLFRESGGAKSKNLESQFIWLDEGIATYFESLTDFGDYVTLGGFESRRIQYSRIRHVLENYRLPLKELSTFGRTELQQRDDMVRIYSLSAGLTDMLMNDENGTYEEPLADFLSIMYKRRVKPGMFEKLMGKSYDELDQQYEEYLKVSSDSVERFLTRPETRTELSLAGASLQDAAYDSIGKCVNLNWLDLSQNSVSLKQFSKLKPCTKLHQVILTKCQFGKNALRGLEYLPSLDQLDLSGSSVVDAELASFVNLKSLKTLRLTATRITDQGLAYLAGVKTLQTLDVSRSRVTQQGIATLKASLPNLKITSSN
jgi:hypothetical protein